MFLSDILFGREIGCSIKLNCRESKYNEDEMVGLCTCRTQFRVDHRDGGTTLPGHARLLLDLIRCRGMRQTRIRLLKAGIKRDDSQSSWLAVHLYDLNKPLKTF